MPNFGIGSERVIFSDGEAITSGDLSDISKNVTRRAWEIPGVADLLAFDRLDTSYDGAMASASALKGRNLGAFTIGGGLCPGHQSNVSSVGRGVIGVWVENDSVSLPSASGDGKMLWGVNDNDWAVAHDNPPEGLYRWDLISVSASEVDIATVTRDYKDNTTGAETSEQIVPAKKVQFVYTVTKGAEGSVNGVTIPALPSGDRYFYAVKVTHGSSWTSIVEVIDLTIPLGDLQVFHQVPSHALDGISGISFDGVWQFEQDGALSAVMDTVRSAAWFSPPPQLINPNVRILGFTLAYEISNSTGVGDLAEVKLIRRTVDGATSDVDIADLTSRFTYDGTKVRTFVDLRGLPGAGTIFHPLWGNGKMTKESFAHPYDAATFPFIHVMSPSRAGSKCIIRGITWFAVGG